MREIADLITSKSFKRWRAKHHHSAPWIPHSLVAQIHSLVLSFSAIVSNPEHATLVRRGQAPKQELFARIQQKSELAQLRIMDGVDQSSLGSFNLPPRSHKKRKDPEGKEKSQGGQQKKQRQDDPRDATGWLASLSKKKLIFLPKFPSRCVCKSCADQGMFCSNKGNCRFGERVGTNDVTPAELQILRDFADKRDDIAWVKAPTQG